MGRGGARVVALAAALALIACGSALAIRLQAGNILVVGDGGFVPTALPKTVDAPITIYGHSHIGTVDGSLPPVLKTVAFEFDRHGSVDTTGLPVCTVAKLQSTTVATARRLCPGAIVGKGFAHSEVKFPEQGPIPVSSPITIFNGPRIDGDPSVLAHAYTTVPVPTTVIVPIRIETIHHGRYGYRIYAAIPKIAGGYSIPTGDSLRIGSTWTYRGQRHSFVNARCADGRLQAQAEFGFADGTELHGTFFKPCQVRG